MSVIGTKRAWICWAEGPLLKACRRADSRVRYFTSQLPRQRWAVLGLVAGGGLDGCLVEAFN